MHRAFPIAALDHDSISRYSIINHEQLPPRRRLRWTPVYRGRRRRLCVAPRACACAANIYHHIIREPPPSPQPARPCSATNTIPVVKTTSCRRRSSINIRIIVSSRSSRRMELTRRDNDLSWVADTRLIPEKLSPKSGGNRQLVATHYVDLLRVKFEISTAARLLDEEPWIWSLSREN